eukprot:scaffold110553_cov19-Prasinocladus_malaysianus.AAC.2
MRSYKPSKYAQFVSQLNRWCLTPSAPRKLSMGEMSNRQCTDARLYARNAYMLAQSYINGCASKTGKSI